MKKRLSILIALLIIFALMAGCSPKESTTTSLKTEKTSEPQKTTGSIKSSDEQTSELSNEPVVWSCLIQEFVNAPTTDDQLVWQGLKERFNVQLHLEVVNAADFTTRLNLALGSDDPPNLINAAPGGLTKYYDTGVVVDLAPYLEKYGSNYLAEISKDPIVLKNCKDDKGRMFFFTRLYWDYEYLYLAMNIGQLTELGGKMPTTTDEFYDALKLMHEANPDEYYTRGQWNAGPHSLQTPIYLAYGTFHRWVHFKEGEYVFGPYERKEEMKNAVKFLHQMYEADVIDPEFLVIDQDTYTAKFAAGQVAAVYGWLGGSHMWPTDENGNYLPDSEYDWKVVPALKGPEGHQHSERMNLCDIGLFITKSHPDVPRAVNMFDWLYTPEGIEFMNWGIEGVTYIKDANGKKDLTEEILKDELGMMNGLRARGFYPAIFIFVSDYELYKRLVPETMIIGIEGNRPYRLATNPVLTGTEEENDKLAQLGTDIFTVIDEKLPKFVTGELDIDSEYDSYISELEEIGVQDYINIVKEQYARWLSR